MNGFVEEFADALALIRQHRENPAAVLSVVKAMDPAERAAALISAVTLADWLAQRSGSDDWLDTLQRGLGVLRESAGDL